MCPRFETGVLRLGLISEPEPVQSLYNCLIQGPSLVVKPPSAKTHLFRPCKPRLYHTLRNPSKKTFRTPYAPFPKPHAHKESLIPPVRELRRSIRNPKPSAFHISSWAMAVSSRVLAGIGEFFVCSELRWLRGHWRVLRGHWRFLREHWRVPPKI